MRRWTMLTAAFIAAASLLVPHAARCASPWDVTGIVAVQSAPAQPQVVGPVVAPISKGQPSPFDGVVMNAAAAAEVAVDKEQAAARCDARVEHDVEVKRAELQLQIDTLRAANDAYIKRLALERDINERRLKGYDSDFKRVQRQAASVKWTPLIFAGGVGLGIIVVVVGAYAVRGVRESNI